jgi:hypothetical protein
MLRWLGAVLTALVVMHLGGVWFERSFGATTVPSSFLSSSMLATTQPTTPKRSTATTTTTTRLVESACLDAIVPLNPTCPRQLVVRYLESAGFGHQFTELLFSMYASQYLGLTFTWTPIRSSGDHGHDYTLLIERLGLERLFVEGLGLAKGDDLRQLRQQNASLFGQWVEVENDDKRQFEMACNNSVLAIDGWWHCHGTSERNCFWAPEHAFLFQRFGWCMRAGVEAYGTAFDRCVLLLVDDDDDDDDAQEGSSSSSSNSSSSSSNMSRSQSLPHDTLVAVWHLRFGDVSPRKPGDAFFVNVVQALKQVVATGQMIKHVRVVLVGGGKETSGVPQVYVDSLRGVVVGEDNHDDALLPRFSVERFRDESFEEQFLAMMQADVLIGSGSSVPQVAAMLSGKPLFFDHVAKHGYGYGQEAMAEAVDMDGEGKVLDSLRRVRLMLFEKMRSKETSPCRRRWRDMAVAVK